MNLAIAVTPFSSSFSVAGEIRDFAPGEISTLLDSCVPVGSSVAVSFNGRAAFVGEVLYCQPIQDRYQTNIRINDSAENGLRSTPRFTVKLSAQIFSTTSTMSGTITDISGAGLGLELPSPVVVDGPLAVESDRNIAFGIVRHCREHLAQSRAGAVPKVTNGRVERMFRAGVQLHHVIQKTDEGMKSGSTLGLIARLRSLVTL